MTVHGGRPGHADEVQAALASIVADQDYGAGALSSRRTMESLLKDLLPDRPRDAAILVAAAEHGVAASLRERVEQEGMDAAVAVRLVASSFAKATAFTPEACLWAATELARALGMTSGALPATPPPLSQTAQFTAQPGHTQPLPTDPAQAPPAMFPPQAWLPAARSLAPAALSLR